MFCNKCAAKIPDDSVFCPECGQKLAGPQPAVQRQPAQTVPPRNVPPHPQQSRYAQPLPAADPLTAPLSTASFFWMPFLIAIPIVGFIVLLVWAFSKNTNLNRKHYARSVLIWALISVLLGVIVTIAGGNLLGNLQGIFGSL